MWSKVRFVGYLKKEREEGDEIKIEIDWEKKKRKKKQKQKEKEEIEGRKRKKREGAYSGRDGWSGEEERGRERGRRGSANPNCNGCARRWIGREKGTGDGEGVREERGIGEWDFVGDSLSPAVSSEPSASWIKPLASPFALTYVSSSFFLSFSHSNTLKYLIQYYF